MGEAWILIGPHLVPLVSINGGDFRQDLIDCCLLKDLNQSVVYATY
jgi:hypothetical protein